MYAYDDAKVEIIGESRQHRAIAERQKKEFRGSAQ